MVDQLDEEHDEQPLRQKLEETELPGVCLQSERALHIPRAAAVDCTCCCHRHEQVRRQAYKAFIDQLKLLRSVRLLTKVSISV